MATIEDYPIPVAKEAQPEVAQRGRLANILGGTAIGAVVMPMVMFPYTPPEATSDYAQTVLPAEMAVGAGMAFALLVTIEAAKSIRTHLSKKD